MPVPFDLYLITDGYEPATLARVRSVLEMSTRLFTSSLSVGIQLRAKTLTTRSLLEAALRLRELTAKHGAALLMNDRLDVALAAGADGVHLPANGLPVERVRRLVSIGFLIGVSTHHANQARLAEQLGADFVVFGPVYPPISKSVTTQTGIQALKQVCQTLRIPVFALGGIDDQTACGCLQVGARIASLGFVLGHSDPQVRLNMLLNAIKQSARQKVAFGPAYE